MEEGSSKKTRKAASRPSKRAKTTTAARAGEATPNDRDSAAVVPQQKPKHIRGKRGKLAALIDMPVDVLHEIFMHLHPPDILKLSRLNKQFRTLLMSKQSRPIWRATIENLDDFPPCPSNWNEPQWFNLCYDQHCHFCNENTSRIVEWQMRTRICTKCAKELIIEGYTGDYWRTGELGHKALGSLIPTRAAKRNKRGYLKADVQKLEKEYEASADRVSFLLDRQKVMEDVTTHARICATWASKQVFNRSEELGALRKEREQAIIKELEALGYAKEIANIKYPDYLENHELVKKPQRLTPRSKRLHLASYQSSNHNLSMGEYMERMRTKRLEREYVQLKKDRKHVAAEVLRKYKNEQLPLTDVFPEVLDFSKFPPIKTVLESPADVEVDEEAFTDEIMAQVPALIQDWRAELPDSLVNIICDEEATARRRKQRARLAEMLPYGLGMFEDSDDDGFEDGSYLGGNFPLQDKAEIRNRLPLATTVFTCKTCGPDNPGWFFILGCAPSISEPLFYPGVLGHRCNTRSGNATGFQAYLDGDLWKTEPAAKLQFQSTGRRPWRVGNLRYQPHLSAIATALVFSARQDPKTMTVANMDELNCWFACNGCLRDITSTTVQRVTKAYTWRAAIQHCQSEHRGSGARSSFWACISAEELTQAHKAYINVGEEESEALSSDLKDKYWHCTHCRDLTTEREPFLLEDALSHVEKIHLIEKPRLNVDYYRSYEAGPEPPYVSDIAVTPAVVWKDLTPEEEKAFEESSTSSLVDYQEEITYSDSEDDFYSW